MKKYFPSPVFLIAIMALVSASVAAAAARLQLAEAGRTPYVIALAADASAPERNAAAELASYLKEITGAEFKIVTPAQAAGQPTLAVGPGAARAVMPTLALDQVKLGDDGIVMATVSSHLMLTGAAQGRRGTLYAVYTFLEDSCGVRWWTPHDRFVPRNPSLTIDELNLTYVPAFRYREALYNTLDGSASPADATQKTAQVKFLVQSKFNGHFNAIPADWGGSYYLIGWCHTFEMFMPPTKYFAEHPEWYSEINGKRVAKPSQLCCTNEAMIAELTKNVLAAIAQRPEAGIISVSQNDDLGNNCQCATCRALDSAEGSPSGSLLYCVNKVAEAVDRNYPGFLVETLAYTYTRKPPKSIHPRQNVLIRLALIERSGVQPINSPLNAKLMTDLQNWKAAAPNLFIWDYTADMWGPFTPHPNLTVFAPDTQSYAASNGVGVFFEGNHYAGNARGDFDELKIYLMSHLLWNPRQDADRLVAEFLNGYYGKAGSALKQYLALINAKSRNVRIASCGASFNGDGDAAWMELGTMNQSTKLFNLAETAVADDAVVLNRVRRARLPLDNQWLRRYSFYQQAATAGNQPFLGPPDIASATEACLSRIKEFEGADIQAEGAGDLQRYGMKLRGRIPVALPPQFAKLPGHQVVDIQETYFTVATGATIEPEPKASNGFAAKMDPAAPANWSVQFRGQGGMVTPGKWHVYASVRYDKIKETGIAFTGGIYDPVAGKNRMLLSANIGDSYVTTQDFLAPVPVKTTATATGVGDGGYRLYDLGVHHLGTQDYVWFGTTGGVYPENVKAIYVDRMIFVKEQS